MKHHLPSRSELLELLVLALMVGGLQLVLGSWGWSALFAFGFIWNWSVLNGWVTRKTQERQYRFSMLRAITLLHKLLTAPVARFPLLQAALGTLPAGIFIALVSYSLDAPIPWWAAILGSLAFSLVRFQFAQFSRQSLRTKQ